MGFKSWIKEQIVLKAIEKKRKSTPFDLTEAELHQLPQTEDKLINNSYYFGGNSTDGHSLIFRIAYRCYGCEVFVLYTREGKFYTIDKQAFARGEEPIRLTCMEPGKRWRLEFDGILQDNATGELLPSRFDVTYTATLPPFHAMYHACFIGMARAFAREKWTKEFFAEAMSSDMGTDKSPESKKNQQHHYEQTGRFSGMIEIGGQSCPVEMTAIRDHSFGKRDWNYMQDHIWLMAMTDAGEALNFSIVNYPRLKRIFVGYTNIGLDHNVSLKDYKLLEYDHNNGLGTDRIVVECLFTDGRRLLVKAQRKENVVTPFDGGNYYFQEGIADYDISGVKARGTIEYGFNGDSSRWDKYID